MHYALFEDIKTAGLLPLAYCQPAFDLRCGIFTARERAKQLFGSSASVLFVRSYLQEVIRERTGLPIDETTIQPELFLNGRLLLTETLVAAFSSHTGERVAFIANDSIAAAIIRGNENRSDAITGICNADAESLDPSFQVVEVAADFIEHPWDLIRTNPELLTRDALQFPLGTSAASAHISEGATILHPENVYIGEDSHIGAGVILDATEGPVVVDAGAVIMHQAVVTGPAYVGKQSIVKIGARIYENTTIGPRCKAGGEIEGSIMAGYANKQHDGFLGHSYLAPWTNLGADTNTSDLKNNYSSIRTTIEGTEHETGMQFLGLLMADHAKSGINSMFNTGTTVGVGCNVYGGGFPPKHIPHFSWGGAEGFQEYDIEKFLDTAARVTARRDVALTEPERALLRFIYTETAPQRRYT